MYVVENEMNKNSILMDMDMDMNMKLMEGKRIMGKCGTVSYSKAPISRYDLSTEAPTFSHGLY